MWPIIFPAMGFGAGIQMSKNSPLLPVLITWSPAVDAEEHKFPVGSVLSLATWWACFGHCSVTTDIHETSQISPSVSLEQLLEVLQAGHYLVDCKKSKGV